MFEVYGKKRDGIVFLCGLAAGAVAGVYATMDHFRKKTDKEVEERVDAYIEYFNKSVMYKDCDTAFDPEGEDVHVQYKKGNPEVIPEASTDYVPNRMYGPLSSEERDEIRQKLLDNYAQTSEHAINYAKISMEGYKTELDEDDNTMTPEEIADSEHKENINKPPRIISYDEYSSLPAYIDTQTLYFYHDDMVLTDDNDEEIPDYGRILGDCLEKYDFINSDEALIFVRNYQLDTAYEIQRVYAAFGTGE